MKRAVVGVLAALVLTACGSEGDEPTAEAETKSITVVIQDSVPLSVYSNYDDKTCWAGDGLTGEPRGGSLPTLTVENDEGRILATQEAPLTGGTWGTAGCRVPVTLDDVEVADFYRVTLSAPEGDFEAVMEGSKSAVELSVD